MNDYDFPGALWFNTNVNQVVNHFFRSATQRANTIALTGRDEITFCRLANGNLAVYTEIRNTPDLNPAFPDQVYLGTGEVYEIPPASYCPECDGWPENGCSHGRYTGPYVKL